MPAYRARGAPGADANARNISLEFSLSRMQIFILFALVYAASFSILAVLLILETEICPHSLRRMLADKRLLAPLTPEEEKAQVDLRATRARRLKNLQAADPRQAPS